MTNTSKQLIIVALIALFFIVLKLMGQTALSWWLILAPIWLPIVVGTIVYLIMIKQKEKLSDDNKWKKLFEDMNNS